MKVSGGIKKWIYTILKDRIYIFDKELPAEVNDLINSASATYGTPQAEESLMRAFFLEPDNLEVLVALYRYFYYQHKYENALVIAKHALKFSGQGVDFTGGTLIVAKTVICPQFSFSNQEALTASHCFY